jgi:large subunit ribosomal protein L2
MEPLKRKTYGRHKSVGRNNQGRITSMHRGGGVKRLFRVVDFRQLSMDVPATVAALEYDPNRTARLARLHFANGAKSYILAPQDLKVGDTVLVAERTPVRAGNRMKLKNIPQGTLVHNIELAPSRGGMIVRSAGSAATIMAHDGGLTQIQLPSSEMRLVNGECFALIGQVSNQEYLTISLGKAGRARWLGRRPKVRGTAKNPVDHPYGGGEGRQGRGTRRPKTMHGKVTGGRKTRNPKKKSNKFIVRRRIK